MSSFVVQPLSGSLRGTVRVPGDKSIGHRAVMFGSLCQGEVVVRGLSDGADNASTVRAMQSLGVNVRPDGEALVIAGVGLDGLRAPSGTLDCGNSGTTMRLLCGLLAGQGFPVTLEGDPSLTRRPMRRVTDPLARMGATIDGASGAKQGESYPPLRIQPSQKQLTGIDYELPIASAQVKSAVLLAGLYASGQTTVREPGSTRNHTEQMLMRLGAPIHVTGRVVTVSPDGWDRRLSADVIQVPGDPSSAAFIVAASALVGADGVCVQGVCTNHTRTGFIDALSDMGVTIDQRAQSSGDDIADLMIAGRPNRATVVSGDQTVRSIDELPILAVVAARSPGNTEFRDAAELRVKESDRIATTVAMLRRFGVQVDERPDGFVVHGDPDRLYSATTIDAAGDHRIAMSAAVAALVADGPIKVDDVDNVATSFPTFVATMRSLGARIENLK